MCDQIKKQCSVCEEFKILDDFHKGNALYGKSTWCKDCMGAYNKKKREEDKEQNKHVYNSYDQFKDTKGCLRCYQELLVSSFTKNLYKKDALASYCKECMVIIKNHREAGTCWRIPEPADPEVRSPAKMRARVIGGEKEERKRKKTYPHFKGIKGLYKKRGFYYWQPPQKDGIRPKAIALRTKDYNEALKKLDEIEEGFELTEYTEVGNVYLMKSDRNGRVKIGRTKDKPVYRERTLQSQEPEVRLIFHREVLFMMETEKYLHRFFKRKRFCGEWFDLSEDDIKKAKCIIEKGVGGSLFSKVAHE